MVAPEWKRHRGRGFKRKETKVETGNTIRFKWFKFVRRKRREKAVIYRCETKETNGDSDTTIFRNVVQGALIK